MRIDAAVAQTFPVPAGQTRASEQESDNEGTSAQQAIAENSSSASRSADSEESGGRSGSGPDLTREEQKQVAELKRRDIEVRNHERAHLGAAGGLARGGASFSYETGPDGRRYAVGGEVSIDTSKVPDDPAATVQRMRRVQRAALAPADPSPQDRQVAVQAARKAAEAQRDLNAGDGEKGSLVDLTV